MIVESKSNLARLMATENLVVEQKNVPTAYFDIKDRVLTIPTLNGKLSPELIDLLLGHEVGHALETPEHGWHNSVVDLKVNKTILNVCEDVRIEKKIKRRFPGLRPSFLKGYRELMGMDFFGVQDRNINSLKFIDRMNLHCKIGVYLNISFTDYEQSLIREAEECESFEQTLAVAQKIQKYTKEEMEKRKEEGKARMKAAEKDGDESFEDDFFDSMEMDDGDTGDSSNSSEKEDNEDSKSKDEEESKKQDRQEDDSRNNSYGKEGSNDLTASDLDSETDNIFREREKELYDKSNMSSTYSDIPELKLENIIVPYKNIISEIEEYNIEMQKEWNISETEMQKRQNDAKADLSKFRSESNTVVSYLVKEFELRKNAAQSSRARVSKTGELNMSKIYEYGLTDDIFKRLTKIPNGKSHGLVMFIDWSGSMANNIHSTMKQLLNLVYFCRKVNIPFEVYAFTSHYVDRKYAESGFPVNHFQNPKVGDIKISGFNLLNLFSSKMSSSELQKMSMYMFNFRHLNYFSYPDNLALGGTPLNHSIVSAFTFIPKFKAEHRLDIVNTIFLTDGESGKLDGRYISIPDSPRSEPYCYDSRGLNRTLKNRIFIRDPKTKATVEISPTHSWRGGYAVGETMALLKLLKQRTGSNLIGFYVSSLKDLRRGLELYTDQTYEERQKTSEIIRKNDYYVISNRGYDDYYFLRSEALDIDDDEEFEVKSTTTRGLVSAFAKYTSGKVSSRIVLNRFIGLIT